MVDLVGEIARADEVEIEKLLKAVLRRYTVLFPDWELSAIFLQKNSNRNKQLDQIIELLQKMKNLE